MPTLAEIRARPGGEAYSDMNDQQLADSVYGKFYSDLPRDEFDKKIGLGKPEPQQEGQRPFMEKLGSFARNVYENPPPTIAGIRDVVKGARGASMELVNPASPDTAREAAGTAMWAATLGVPLAPGPGGAFFGVPVRGAKAVPPVPPTPGTVRFYHGGSDPTSGGGRWVTPDYEYARNYRPGEPVSYVDIPENSPHLLKSFDDTGTSQVAPYVSFEAPEEIARNLKSLTGAVRPAPPSTVGPAPPPTVGNEAVEAAGRIGVDLPRYLATEGTQIPQIAAGIKNIPIAGEPIVQSAQKLIGQMGRVKNELIPGSRSPEIAGGEAKEALGSWIKEGSKKPVSKAYEAVDSLIDPEVMVPLRHTAGAVDEIIATRVQSRIPGTSKAADTVLDAIAGPMDYAGIKGLRSFLGERTPQEMIASGINPVEHKRIYAALTKDLENVVREAGGPDAMFAWKYANTLARMTSMQRNTLTKITGIKGDAAPEAVFSRIAAYAGSKSSADIGKLRLAKGLMGPKAWDEIGSAYLNRLGSGPDGEFSAARFVIGFGNISPAPRKELFKTEHLSALNDLYTVSKHIRDRIDRFSNPSGTSRSLFTGGAIGGALIDPISLVSSMVGGRIAAEALSRPAVVKAAATVGRAVIRRDPVMTRQAVDRLQQLLVRGGLVSGASQQNPRQENMASPSQ